MKSFDRKQIHTWRGVSCYRRPFCLFLLPPPFLLSQFSEFLAHSLGFKFLFFCAIEKNHFVLHANFFNPLVFFFSFIYIDSAKVFFFFVLWLSRRNSKISVGFLRVFSWLPLCRSFFG